MTKVGKDVKALFIQRLIAFIIDAFLVSLVVSFVSLPLTDSKKVETLENKTIQLMEKFTKNEITMDEFTSEYISIYYRIGRDTGVTSLLTIFFGVCYFVVYQTYKNGQTVGKKLMKIRVISDDGELFMNQMILRSFLANSLLMNICIYLFMLFSSKNVYFYSSVVFELIQYIVVIISVIMIMYRKDGCSIHDKLLHTKVIKEK